MAKIVDYASLSSAIQDFAHRSDIYTAAGYGSSAPFTDYFIQSALEQIPTDIFDLNFGNGIQFMENAYAPSQITGGSLPVPSDWLAPKVFYVSDGSSDDFTLIFKAAAWINDNYPERQAEGLPAYIARDVMYAAGFTASLANTGVLTVTALASGLIQTGMILSDGAIHLPANTPGNAVIITGQTSSSLSNGLLGSTGLYTAASINPLAPTYTVSSEAMTGGGNIFTFGPYPDSAYQVTGTYYQAIPNLSSSSTTNWVVLNAPTMLLAACMVQCGQFIKDASMVSQWQPDYQTRLKALVDRDKAERWAASTMAIDVG